MKKREETKGTFNKEPEKEPVNFEKWYGSWKFFDKEIDPRGSKTETKTEDPGEYYRKRWKSDP